MPNINMTATELNEVLSQNAEMYQTYLDLVAQVEDMNARFGQLETLAAELETQAESLVSA